MRIAARLMQLTPVYALCAAALCPQVPLNDKTDDMHNGRFWNGMPTGLTKTTYIMGFMDALPICSLGVERGPKGPPPAYRLLQLTHSRVTIGEYMETLDVFYSEPMNRPIPVMIAMNWVRLKASGASEAELKDYEAKARALAVQ
jgi:hypothetical protein